MKKTLDSTDDLMLVENGIFPIIFDENGKRVKEATELESRFPGTVQGEGMFAGSLSLFLRTSGCNLRCIFKPSDSQAVPNKCDTWYSSFEHEQNWVTQKSAEKIIRNNVKKGQHLVISGGEPFLQAKKLAKLLDSLKDLELIVTVETNGTIYNEELCKRISLISLSPKLSNSTPTDEKCKASGIFLEDGLLVNHEKYRNNLLPIQKFVNFSHENSNTGVQLKFVVTCERDIEEIKSKYLKELEDVTPQMIYLMPEGITQKEMQEKSKWVINKCIEEDFIYCPRLHIEVYGEKREV